MSQSVGQAVSSTAGFGNAGDRHSRRSEQDAGAFGEALAVPRSKTTRIDAGPSTRPGLNGREWQRTEQRSDTAATPFDGSAEAVGRPTIGLGSGHAATLSDDIDGTADEADAKSEPKADEPIGLPMQIKAEQTISAIMTLSRQYAPTRPEGDTPGAAPGGKADPAMVGPLASDGEKTPLAQHGRPSSHSAATPLQSGASATPPRPESKPDTTAGSASQPSQLGAATTSIGAVLARPEAAAASAQTVAKAERRQQGTAAPEPQDRPATSARTASDSGVQPARHAEAAAAAVETSAAPEMPTAASGGPGTGAEHDVQTRQEAAREARRSDSMPAAASISVIAERAAPAPAAPSLSASGAAIVNAIDKEQSWRDAQPSSSASLAAGTNRAQPMRSLKIQLHPAELGMVTAHLRTAGDQLSVELQVDSHEAYHRLTAESDAIVKSLRSLGFDIDRVSIQQPQAAAGTVARTDAATATGTFGGDAPSFQPGSSGNGGERFGGQTGGRGHGSGGHGSETAQPINQNRAGGGLYI